MASTENELAETKKGIHSLLLSSKDGLSAYELERDYKNFMFRHVPYKALGFGTCAEMLDRMHDVCRRAYDKTGSVIYKAIPTDKTAHLEVMIAHQKPKKKKAKGGKFSSTSRKPKSAYSFQATQKYNPSSYSKSYMKRPSRTSYPPSPVYHSYGRTQSQHPVHSAGRWPTGHSYEQPAPRPSYRPQATPSQPQVRHPRPQVASVSVTIRNENKPPEKQGEAEMRSMIEELLKAYPTGVWLHMLPDMYHGRFGIVFPPYYKDVILRWTDLVDVQQMHGKEILYMATEESRRDIAAARKYAQQMATHGQEASNDEQMFSGDIHSAARFYIGEKCQVYVSHVIAESCRIYVQRSNSTVNELMEEISTYYESIELRTYNKIPGHCVCAAKDSTYNAWSRASVTNTDYHTKAQLFYVDFGNVEVKPVSELQPLTDHFTSLPAQAIAVRLDDIVSDDMSLLSKEFESLTHQVPLELHCISVEGGVCSVTLVDMREPDTTINSKLVSLGLAQWEDGSPSPHHELTPTKPLNKSSSNPSISPIRAPSPIQRRTGQVNGSSRSSESSVQPSESSLPDSEYWTVIVTHILTPSSLFVRIKDNTSDEFSQFQEEVEKVYGEEKPVSMLHIGQLYVAYVTFSDDAPGYYRVKATQLLDTTTVDCEFVDYGFQYEVELNKIYAITRDGHAQLAYQARRCALYGMDQVRGDNESVMAKLDEMTDEKTLIAQLITVEQGIPHIVLFDTSREDEDLEINKELGSMLEDEGLQAALPEVGQTMDVAVPYINGEGTLYVQPIGPGNLLLLNVMSAINDFYTQQNTSSEDFVTNPQEGQLVCAKYEGTWYRAIITKVLPQRKVTVLYGDYGNVATLQTIHLRKLPSDIEHVTTLPMQALACKLSGLDDWNDEVGMEAAHLTQSHDSFVLMTVQSATEGQRALVQLTNGNLHLNNHLLNIYEQSQVGSPSTTSTVDEEIPAESLTQVQETTNMPQDTSSPGTPPDSPPDESVTETAAGSAALSSLSELGAGDYVSDKLEKLHLDQDTGEKYQARFVSPPQVGEWWDVFVTTTNEPGHFVVVPLVTMDLLNKLNDIIHSKLKDSALVVFEPQPGDMCAGRGADDGYWYRVLVLEGKIGDKFKVIFTDYGNYDFMDLERLRPLSKEYQELPIQAVRAGLHGVEPARGNCWTETANQAFADLCDEQRLVSKIRSVDRTKNLLSSGPSVLFELWDTAKEGESLDIESELVKLGHAKFK